MLTANALPEHCQASLAAGADGHVSKPVTATELLAALNAALDDAEAAAAAESKALADA
jgi:CheY-like chemotaxis protein